MTSNDSILEVDLPKHMSLPQILAMFLKFSQFHPWGGTPNISNDTFLVSQQSSMDHFLTWKN